MRARSPDEAIMSEHLALSQRSQIAQEALVWLSFEFLRGRKSGTFCSSQRPVFSFEFNSLINTRRKEMKFSKYAILAAIASVIFGGQVQADELQHRLMQCHRVWQE